MLALRVPWARGQQIEHCETAAARASGSAASTDGNVAAGALVIWCWLMAIVGVVPVDQLARQGFSPPHATPGAWICVVNWERKMDCELIGAAIVEFMRTTSLQSIACIF